jgi:hypothetical protein
MDVAVGTERIRVQALATLGHKGARRRRLVLRVVYGGHRGLVDPSHYVCDCIVHATSFIRVRLEPIVRWSNGSDCLAETLATAAAWRIATSRVSNPASITAASNIASDRRKVSLPMDT